MGNRPRTSAPDPHESAVTRAQAGDRDALAELLLVAQAEVYPLALRFLWHPQDAEDATQDTLLRVARGLPRFRHASAFRTWVHRIAINVLRSAARRRKRQRAVSFEAFAEDLSSTDPEAPPVPAGLDHQLLLEEVKIGCTLALLLCLPREQRLAYILGEILELDHREAADALAVAPATYRQRLARARARIQTFMTAKCGLIAPSAACRCHDRLPTAIARGRVDPERLLFASATEQVRRFPEILARIRDLEEAQRATALYRVHRTSALPSQPIQPATVALRTYLSWADGAP